MKTTLNILCGFDGFIDNIVKPIQTSNENGNVYFSTIQEFGVFLADKAGKSCSLQLETKQRRFGGNAPIFASAASHLGGAVSCIGALGNNGFDEAFAPLQCCKQLFSVAEPGTSTALEFDDGKILLAQNSDLDNLNYARLIDRLGAERLSALIEQSDVFALLNWSELKNATDLWQGILDNCVNNINLSDGIRMLVDLCDCSAKTSEQMEEMLHLLRGFAKHVNVLLTVNENEAESLQKHFNIEKTNILQDITKLYEKLGVQNVVIHAIGYACGKNSQEIQYVPTVPVAKPIISTGAGDHFNAGLAIGWGGGLALKKSLELGNEVTCFYVSTGESPSKQDVPL